jgi:hypothetical protein
LRVTAAYRLARYRNLRNGFAGFLRSAGKDQSSQRRVVHLNLGRLDGKEMTYTPEQQKSDRSFLVGANYGRGAEAARVKEAIKELRKTSYDTADLDELESELGYGETK